jgi:transcription elongation factor GreA-like protein/transcription elongation GreA/GreB family factor
MEYLKQFQKHLEQNDLPSIVNLWQEYCLSDEIDPEEAIQILKGIKHSTLCDPFGCYIEQILPLWETLPESDKKHTLFCLIFDIETSNEHSLGEMAFNYLQARHGTDPSFLQKARLVGLREMEKFRGCISNFDTLNHMVVGNFFLHNGGWGTGEVMEVSTLREQVILEFDYVGGQKDLSFENAFKTLVPIPKTHFLAMRFGNPDDLEKIARADPVKVIRLLLSDLGPKSAQDIKDELCDLVIPEADWTRWWQTARSKIKKDTLIEVPENVRDVFRLRFSEMSHEERLQKALSSKPDANGLIEMIYSFMRDFPVAFKNEDFKASLRTQLVGILSSKEISDGQEIQILFFLQDLDYKEDKSKIQDLLSRFSKIEDVIQEIHVVAYKKRFLTAVRVNRQDWKDIFLKLLLTVEGAPLKDYILGELLAAKETAGVVKRLEELLFNPKIAPSALLWYFQKIMQDEELPFSDQEGKDRFFEAFFTLLYTIETEPSYRELVKKMHQFLSGGRYQNVRTIFQGASKTVVKEILLLSTKCQTLSDHDIKILYSLAEVVHPSIGKGNQKDEEEETIVWTTEEGYNKLKSRIHQIATVETVQNAKEIEVARSHGDLRENSEFKFALERRDRLQSELRFLSQQLSSMRILSSEDVHTDTVSVGTVVSLKNSKGESTRYTLLGPWDADPENNILSFQSKLAQSLKDLPVGSKCQIQNQEWEIVKIHSFFG